MKKRDLRLSKETMGNDLIPESFNNAIKNQGDSEKKLELSTYQHSTHDGAQNTATSHSLGIMA